VNPERITGRWRLAASRAGLARWRLHDLRHWSATLAIGSGHDLRTVANRLGHPNPAMTLRVNAHAPDIADQAVHRRQHQPSLQQQFPGSLDAGRDRGIDLGL
jgi:integrase